MSKENQQPGKLNRREFLKSSLYGVSGGVLGLTFLGDSMLRFYSKREEVAKKLADAYPNVTPITRVETGGAGPAVASVEVVVGYEVSGTSSEEEKKRIIETYTQDEDRLNKDSTDGLRDKIDFMATAIGCALTTYGALLLRKTRLSSAPDESLIVPASPQSPADIGYSDFL